MGGLYSSFLGWLRQPGTCDVTGDSDNLYNMSQPVTSNIVTHDCDLWDGEHHVTSLSGHPGYIENDARVIASSVMRITRFIQKHSIEGRSIEQFPPILGISSIMWQLFQTMSASGWDRFKISPTPNAPSLVEAMRTLYSPSVPEEPSPDVEIAVDEPVVEEVPFTTVTAKKHKARTKLRPLLTLSPPLRTLPHLLPWSQEPLRRSQPRKLLQGPPI